MSAFASQKKKKSLRRARFSARAGFEASERALFARAYDGAFERESDFVHDDTVTTFVITTRVFYS